MSKQEFLIALRRKLKGMPKREVDERISFYSEMIDDHIEEGCTESEAVAKIGYIDDISGQIVSEVHLAKPKKKRRTREIVLLAVGSPLWISLAAAAFAVVVALYSSLWAVIVSIWAAFVALTASSVAGIAAALPFGISGGAPVGFAMLGASLVCLGLAIFSYYGCRKVTRGVLVISKKLARCIKICFRKKGEI